MSATGVLERWVNALHGLVPTVCPKVTAKTRASLPYLPRTLLSKGVRGCWSEPLRSNRSDRAKIRGWHRTAESQSRPCFTSLLRSVIVDGVSDAAYSNRNPATTTGRSRPTYAPGTRPTPWTIRHRRLATKEWGVKAKSFNQNLNYSIKLVCAGCGHTRILLMTLNTLSRSSFECSKCHSYEISRTIMESGEEKRDAEDSSGKR